MQMFIVMQAAKDITKSFRQGEAGSHSFSGPMIVYYAFLLCFCVVPAAMFSVVFVDKTSYSTTGQAKLACICMPYFY